MMNRSAKGGTRSSPHYGGEGVLIHPPYQGVCGRHGTEDQDVTPGERDRGEPRGSSPPTPPGIRVRTTAVRSDYAVEKPAKRGRPTESKYALRSAC